MGSCKPSPVSTGCSATHLPDSSWTTSASSRTSNRLSASIRAKTGNTRASTKPRLSPSCSRSTEIVRGMFHGLDYRAGLADFPQERLTWLAGAIEWALDFAAAGGRRRIERGGQNARASTSKGSASRESHPTTAWRRTRAPLKVIGNDHLRVIAHELLSSLKSNASVDWQHRESARVRMRSSAFSANTATRRTFRTMPCRPSCYWRR